MITAARFGWAVAVGLSATTAGFAQTTGTAGTTSVGTTNTSAGGLGIGSSTPTGLGAGQNAAAMQQAPTISAFDPSTGVAPSTLNSSNALGKYYANPTYPGRAGADQSGSPGGFGSPLYGSTVNSGAAGTVISATGGGLNRTTGVIGGTTSASGRTPANGVVGTTGFPGQTGIGGTSPFGGRAAGVGVGGQNTGAASVGGQIATAPRPIAYTSTLQLPVPAPAVRLAKLETDLRAIVDRSVVISAPQNIGVSIVDGVVVLRGTARDDDESRLVEGMIRLTPGVTEVRNELVVNRPQP
ncbi:MAG: BON domain-containing protein [Fimbriiglobus sp.]